MLELLHRLLVTPPCPKSAPDVATWLREVGSALAELETPIDRAVMTGFNADRVGYAFAGGYQAALSALVPGLGRSIVSLSATEAGGNRPSAIKTRLTVSGERVTVTGDKRYSTLAPVADTLLVVASEGTDESGRNRLRVVRIDARAHGVQVRKMPDIAFAPEIPHAEVRFDDVTASADAVLPGDGYTAYLKPFRTVEDVHVHAALLGYVASVARRFGWPETVVEAIASLVVTARSLALGDPSRPELHVALSGWLTESAALLERADEHWARVDEAERERWRRDRALSLVARGVREQRRARAWQILREGEKGRPT